MTDNTARTVNPSRWLLLGLLWIGCCAAFGATLTPAQAADEPTVTVTPEGSAKAPPVSEEEPIPTKNLWEILQQGGPLMIPIAICSLILVAFVLERTISLRRGRVIPGPFTKRFLKQLSDGDLDRDTALKLCEENGSPVADVLAGAVRKWGRPAVEVEQAIIDAGERSTNGLRKYLRVINGVATVTPLLGLLGTVVGMIRAFNNIATADALGRPELLAGGISQALLTTAFGLSVAIPALIFYLFFVSRVDQLIIEIDAIGQEVVNTISAEELKSKAGRPAKPRRSKQESTT